MARELWAKVYVNLRHHPKLIGRPDADFRLWVGLILHAKEHCPDFIVRDLSPADMRGAFGIKAPVRVVEQGLQYFISKEMLVEVEGGLLIRDMAERQAKSDSPEAQAERQAKYYNNNRDAINERRRLRRAESHAEPHVVLRETTNGITRESVTRSHAEVDLDKDLEKETSKSSRSKSLEAKASRGVAFAPTVAPRQEPAGTGPVWDAYSAAYHARYKAEPVRNGKVNGQLAQLVKRLGAEESPDVAAWYVSHAGALYVRSGHCVDLLLRDAEKLRTEWATGRQITGTQARQTDRTQSNLEAIKPLLRGGEV